MICPYCSNEIDPDVCHCGEIETLHGSESGHNFVPMGCTCGYADQPRTDKHVRVARWLENGKYRRLVHRHSGGFVAADESVNLMMTADTIPLLADALLNWPEDSIPITDASQIFLQARKLLHG